MDSISTTEPSVLSTTPTYDRRRLGMPYPVRAVLSTSAGFFCGVVLGMTQGGLMAGLRYRAENAHRLPKSQTGWFLYHKTKNYHVALGAVREGALMGIKVGIWTLLFFTIEEAVDRLREGLVGTRSDWRWGQIEGGGLFGVAGRLGLGEKDAVNTVCAGLGSAGAFSLWNKFPLPTAARTARIGLLAGIGFGFIQDVLYLARGNRLWYVDLVSDVPGKVMDWQAMRRQKKVREYLSEDRGEGTKRNTEN